MSLHLEVRRLNDAITKRFEIGEDRSDINGRLIDTAFKRIEILEERLSQLEHGDVIEEKL